MTSLINFVTSYWYVGVIVLAVIAFMVVKKEKASTTSQATPLASPVPQAPVASSNALPAPVSTAPASKLAAVSVTVQNQFGTSNTPDPSVYPPFSPAGYPYFYALVPDGKGGTTVYKDANGNILRTVLVNGTTFPSDQAAEAAIAAKTASDGTARVNEYLSVNYKNKLPAGSVQEADAMYIIKMQLPFQQAVKASIGNANLDFCILSGTQAAINGALSTVLNSMQPQLAKFNPATYTGVVKAKYAELVEGITSGSITVQNFNSDTGQPV